MTPKEKVLNPVYAQGYTDGWEDAIKQATARLESILKEVKTKEGVESKIAQVSIELAIAVVKQS